MTDDALTAEELASWVTPRKTLNHVLQFIKKEHLATEAIVLCLRGGAIKSAAKSSALEIDDKVAPFSMIVRIPIGNWSEFSSLYYGSFWQTGDARLYLGNRNVRIGDIAGKLIAATYFGVRFDPVGLNEWFAEMSIDPLADDVSKNTPLRAVKTPGAAAPIAINGPRVSDPLLRAWYELYQRAYPGADDTEPNAILSANGMFHGKSVSRDRIRVLRGQRKAGRKPTKTSE